MYIELSNLLHLNTMAGPKSKLSRIYSKSTDRNFTHVYKGGKRFDKTLSIDRKAVYFTSGNATLRNNPKVKSLKVVALDHSTVVQKVYDALRLNILKKITLNFKNVTKADYCIRFNKYPHQLIRFHSIATGPKADRLSTGMRNAFGRVFTCGARVKPQDTFLELFFSEKLSNSEDYSKFLKDFKYLKSKFPFKLYIVYQ